VTDLRITQCGNFTRFLLNGRSAVIDWILQAFWGFGEEIWYISLTELKSLILRHIT